MLTEWILSCANVWQPLKWSTIGSLRGSSGGNYQKTDQLSTLLQQIHLRRNVGNPVSLAYDVDLSTRRPMCLQYDGGHDSSFTMVVAYSPNEFPHYPWLLLVGLLNASHV